MKQSLVFACVLPFFTACSSDEPGPGAAGSRLRTEGGFCTEWARVACNPAVVNACESDSDGCQGRQAAFCEDLVPTGYNAKNAEDCIAAVKTAYSDATLTAKEAAIVLHLAADCSKLVVGGRHAGESCADSFECDTVHDYECVIKPGASTGTCQVPEVAAGGQRCDEPQIVCEDGNYCDPDAGRCFEIASEGDDCQNDAMCGPDALCTIAADTPAGTCGPKLQPRDPCASDQQCESGFCVNQTCRTSVDLSLDTPLCNDL